MEYGSTKYLNPVMHIWNSELNILFGAKPSPETRGLRVECTYGKKLSFRSKFEQLFL